MDKRLKTLKEFSCSRKKKDFLYNASNSEIHTLCEVIYNFLYSGNLANTKPTVKRYCRLKNTLVSLADEKLSVSRKRELLLKSQAIRILIGRTLTPKLEKDYQRGYCQK